MGTILVLDVKYPFPQLRRLLLFESGLVLSSVFTNFYSNGVRPVGNRINPWQDNADNRIDPKSNKCYF